LKKLFLFTTVLCTAMLLFMGQKSQDRPEKWSQNPLQTGIYDPSVVSNAPLPQEYDYYNPNAGVKYYNSPSGVAAVNPNFRILPRTGSYQSEVIITRHPTNPLIMYGSSNAFNNSGSLFISEGVYVTTNGGSSWFGSDTMKLSGGSPVPNQGGDPGIAIDKNGNLIQTHLGFSTSGMFGNYSTDNGISWSTNYTIASGSQDKNLAATDDAPASPFYGRTYVVWSEFNASNPPIAVSYTTNGGVSWSAPAIINVPPAGHYSQGCDVRVGPNGDVYVVWAAPISSSPFTEDYAGFAKSTNGGVSWTVTENAYDMNGIRGTFPSKSNIRVNGFTRLDVDKSGGARNGWIYIVSSEKNLAPAGSDPDVVLHRSTNGGATWSAGVRVNQDALNNGKYQFFPAIRVDESGGVNIVYYDDRNTASDSSEIYMSRSIDGGVTFSDVLVSDHRFKPKSIGLSGIATGYMGDYIGVTSGNNKIWPLWMDDITGISQAWTTSIDLGPGITHTPLSNTEQLSGSYAVNAVITPSGSNIDPSKTKLYWSRNNVNITDSVLMSNPSGNNWTANIPANGTTATYRYYIKTADLLSRVATSPAGAPAVLNTFLASTDNVKPVITHTPLVDQAKAFWPATVPATVTDNLGLDSVWVKWYKNTPSPVKQFKLINQGGNSFSAAFNSLNSDVAINDSIFYRIFAQDNSLGHNRDSTSLYKFKITELQLCENFELVTYPPDLWTLDYSGTLYWTREAVSAYGIGAGATKFNFYNASAGTIQSLITLPFSNSVLGDSIAFDNAYAPYTSGTDSLILETSTNGGTTYTTLVSLYGSAAGGTLNTAPAQTGSFTPTSSQWARRNYTLPVGTNMIKFRARSGFGNNLYLDNICKVAGGAPLPPPIVTADQDSVIAYLSVGPNSTTKNLMIGNLGGSNLNWSLNEINAVFSPIASAFALNEAQLKEVENMPKGAADVYHGPEVNDNAGGPDAYGYIWDDSNQPGGPVYNWIDITGTGTAIASWTNGTADDGSVIVPLATSIPYYGTNYSQLKICTNGWISFDVASTNTAYSNATIPAAAEPNNTLYPLWDDLNLSTSGTVYYYNDVANSRFIVEYKDVPHYDVGGPYTFEVIINYNGTIVYQYQNITTPDNSCTIGFENSTGTDGLQMVYNATYVQNNLAVRIQKGGLDWLTENPLSGTISPAGNQNVDLVFNSTGLTAGTYTGKVRITSNDPSTPQRDVKVRLNVGTAVPASITVALQGFYNNTTLNIRDTTRIYLRNTSPPYAIVDSAKAVIDSLNFTGSFLFANAPTGTYYLQVKSRNGLETWSKAGGQLYTAGSAFSYNFTTAAAQAYGSNEILKNTKYCQYSGDVNQNGIIDLTDVILINNDASAFLSGYRVTDVNGDSYIDLSDIVITSNNASNFVNKVVPPGADPSAKNSDQKTRSEKINEDKKIYDSYMRLTDKK